MSTNEQFHEVLREYSAGADRARVLGLLYERPRSDYELARALGLDHRALEDHLSVLVAVDLVRTSIGLDSAIYLLTNHAREEWDGLETVIRSPDAVTSV